MGEAEAALLSNPHVKHQRNPRSAAARSWPLHPASRSAPLTLSQAIVAAAIHIAACAPAAQRADAARPAAPQPMTHAAAPSTGVSMPLIEDGSSRDPHAGDPIVPVAGGSSTPNLDTDGDGVLDAVDTDGDQVPDSRDACPLTPGKVPPGPNDSGCPQAGPGVANLIVARVPFRWNSAQIIAESVPSLELFEQAYRKHRPNRKPHVIGHASPDEPASEQLAMRRAFAVIGWLRVRGIDTRDFVVQHVGARSPAAAATTNAGRAQNRRVELQFGVDPQ